MLDSFLLPESLEDYVGEDNPVRFIEGFVDQLDLIECGFIEERSTSAGRPGYNPSDMLKPRRLVRAETLEPPSMRLQG